MDCEFQEHRPGKELHHSKTKSPSKGRALFEALTNYSLISGTKVKGGGSGRFGGGPSAGPSSGISLPMSLKSLPSIIVFTSSKAPCLSLPPAVFAAIRLPDLLPPNAAISATENEPPA